MPDTTARAKSNIFAGQLLHQVKVRTLRELARQKVRKSKEAKLIRDEYNPYRHVSLYRWRTTGISQPEQYLLWTEEIEEASAVAAGGFRHF